MIILDNNNTEISNNILIQKIITYNGKKINYTFRCNRISEKALQDFADEMYLLELKSMRETIDK